MAFQLLVNVLGCVIKGLGGIKAIIVYPMNALANSQYEDFAQRLHGSGLKIGLYTGDTKNSPEEARAALKIATGREEPYDSELLSRDEIQANPPDILMTNYVMLELLLTRFEDRKLFPKDKQPPQISSSRRNPHILRQKRR